MARINWRQAFAEVGLLAAGALVAFGGDAWFDSHSERVEESTYLESLQEDFEKTRQGTANFVSRNQRSLDVTLELLKALAQPAGTVSVRSPNYVAERL